MDPSRLFNTQFEQRLHEFAIDPAIGPAIDPGTDQDCCLRA
jgi:hypothetical protein